MRADGDLVSELNIDSAAARAIKHGIEHFPPLMSDVCLTNATSVISDQIATRLENGYSISSEVLAYPRKRFGIRPIVVAPLSARALYGAAVRKIQKWLPEPSRANGNWDHHKQFGLEEEVSHIVEFDIASCYEYVDHVRLRDELALRASSAGYANLVASYLAEVQGRNHGLPQLSFESDLLADTYLDILDRRLHRQEFATSRFADDFKVLASSYDEASRVVELCSEYARELCLVLSTEKTRIVKRETAKARYVPEDQILAPYFKDATEARRKVRAFFASDYGGGEEVEIEVDPSEIEFSAYISILSDWVQAAHDRSKAKDREARIEARAKAEQLHGLIPSTLGVLRKYSVPVDPTWLRSIVYDNITRLEQVIKYIVAHPDGRSYWPLVHGFTQQRQQSPWLKLWLIHAAAELASDLSNEHEAKVFEWVAGQVNDRHEIVRAEAAWVLARYDRTSVSELLALYQLATELTRPLLAAAVSKNSSAGPQVVNSLKGDGRLMSEAIQWAAKS